MKHFFPTLILLIASFAAIGPCEGSLINHYTFNSSINVGEDSVGSRDLVEQTLGSGGTVSQLASVTDSNGAVRYGVLRLDDETPISSGSNTVNGSWLENDNNSGTTLSNFTVAMWFRTDLIDNDGFSSMFSNGPNTGNNNFQIDNDTNGIQDRLRLNARNGSIVDPNAFAVDTWIHTAITYDGSETKFYVNGLQSGSTISSGNPGNLFEEIRVGSNRGETRLFDGDFDDLRIYDNALSASEVYALAVPEPSSALLSAILMAALTMRRRHRRFLSQKS